MKKIILASFSAALFAIACTPKVSPAKANEIMPAVPSTETADIAAGHTLFTTNCAKCHGAKTEYVKTHTYDEAKLVMASMSMKAKLSPEQVAQLAAYINSEAKK